MFTTIVITSMFYIITAFVFAVIISLIIITPIHLIKTIIKKINVKKNDTFCYKCSSFEPKQKLYNSIDSYSFINNSNISYYCKKQCIYVHDIDNCDKFSPR